jgi:hypothetical protein
MVKGFVLVFGMGIVVSMFSALVITRTLLIALPEVKKSDGTTLSQLFGNGLKYSDSISDGVVSRNSNSS